MIDQYFFYSAKMAVVFFILMISSATLEAQRNEKDKFFDLMTAIGEDFGGEFNEAEKALELDLNATNSFLERLHKFAIQLEEFSIFDYWIEIIKMKTKNSQKPIFGVAIYKEKYGKKKSENSKEEAFKLSRENYKILKQLNDQKLSIYNDKGIDPKLHFDSQDKEIREYVQKDVEESCKKFENEEEKIIFLNNVHYELAINFEFNQRKEVYDRVEDLLSDWVGNDLPYLYSGLWQLSDEAGYETRSEGFWRGMEEYYLSIQLMQLTEQARTLAKTFGRTLINVMEHHA
uniref:Uncharacterized protein n=1 Tax=Globodera rostochiensis TaxID=31243 RepID=A0A914H4M6_GLORO